MSNSDEYGSDGIISICPPTTFAKIEIKYLPGAHKITQVEDGDWIDLYVYEDTFCPKDTLVYVNLGCAMRLPEGFEGLLVPRSSTFKRWGLIQTNHLGVIDNSYCGNDDIWKMPVIALREDVMVPKDTRLCQFRILQNQPIIRFQEVARLGNNRGGFGSTGE